MRLSLCRQCKVYLDFLGIPKTQHYTALGRTVNLAARLESHAGKKSATNGDSQKMPDILIGETAYNEITKLFGAGPQIRSIPLTLKGIAEIRKAYGFNPTYLQPFPLTPLVRSNP